MNIESLDNNKFRHLVDKYDGNRYVGILGVEVDHNLAARYLYESADRGIQRAKDVISKNNVPRPIQITDISTSCCLMAVARNDARGVGL